MDYSLIFEQLVGPSITIFCLAFFTFASLFIIMFFYFRNLFSEDRKDYLKKSKEYEKYLTEYSKLKTDLGNANHEIKFLENQLAELRYGIKQDEVVEK